MIESLTLSFVIVSYDLETIYIEQVLKYPTLTNIPIAIQVFINKISGKKFDYPCGGSCIAIGFIDYKIKTIYDSFMERLTLYCYHCKNQILTVNNDIDYVPSIIAKINEECKNIEATDKEREILNQESLISM